MIQILTIAAFTCALGVALYYRSRAHHFAMKAGHYKRLYKNLEVVTLRQSENVVSFRDLG